MYHRPLTRFLLLLGLTLEAVVAKSCFIDPVWQPSEIVNTTGCEDLKQRCAWSVPPAHTDIQYGAAFNNLTKKMQPLLLDLYMPPDADRRKKKPAFVLIHGGGFTGGDKARHGAGPGVEAYFAAALAQRGFVAVSINYRLTGLAYGHREGQGCVMGGAKTSICHHPDGLASTSRSETGTRAA